MDAGHIEDGEGDDGGRYRTRAAVAVAELEGGAEVFERCPCEMRPGPMLKDGVSGMKLRIEYGLPAGYGKARGGGVTQDIFDRRGTPRNSQHNEMRPRVSRR